MIDKKEKFNKYKLVKNIMLINNPFRNSGKLQKILKRINKKAVKKLKCGYCLALLD